MTGDQIEERLGKLRAERAQTRERLGLALLSGQSADESRAVLDALERAIRDQECMREAEDAFEQIQRRAQEAVAAAAARRRPARRPATKEKIEAYQKARDSFLDRYSALTRSGELMTEAEKLLDLSFETDYLTFMDCIKFMGKFGASPELGALANRMKLQKV